MHAMDITQIQFDRVPYAKVCMGLIWDVVAKNQQLGDDNWMFMILQLSSVLGRRHSGCIMLRHYLEEIKTSKKQRGGIEEYHGILASSILQAHQHAGLDPPKVLHSHEIKTLASLMQLHTNRSVNDVINGCFGELILQLPPLSEKPLCQNIKQAIFD